jgi:hypothetical protein
MGEAKKNAFHIDNPRRDLAAIPLVDIRSDKTVSGEGTTIDFGSIGCPEFSYLSRTGCEPNLRGK